MKILITGGSGMVGKNLVHFFNKNTNHELFYPTSSDLNLLDNIEVKHYFKLKKPDVIIHCAGLVGGIQANIKHPYSFLSRNLIMGSNVIEAAIANNVEKLINLGSSCMYPKDLDRELEEKDILTGVLEPTNEGYAIAKIAVAKLCEYAKKEFNFNYSIHNNLDNADKLHDHGLFVGNSHADLTKELHYLKRILE